ncbi:MAG: ferrous iron transporter B, partial [Deltaproteobacteria bacterium]|nr:ferrous iron transporter B [Deltaproteobacteria bacterium]
MSSHIGYDNSSYLDEPLQRALVQIIECLKSSYTVSKQTLALLLLQEDPYVEALVQEGEGQNYQKIKELVQKTAASYSEPLRYVITMSRQKAVDALVSQSVSSPKRSSLKISNFLSQLMIHPLTGYPIVALILYYGLYQFVGVFGAGTLVDFIETTLFETHINPWITSVVHVLLPWKPLQDLFVGEYGIFTLGIRYAMAIVLPIVGTFFIAFSLIEDSGYLPRLALLLDRSFKKIGLNGRAVIPMVLGLGCDTMATMVTRILETKREKVIATLLLALAIPCSAQLGLILALLSQVPSALFLWSGVVIGEFFLIGYLTSKLLPGSQPQ